MTAALAQSQRTKQHGDGLSRTRLGRDLYQIAELVEICFKPGLDANGRAAIQEMKFVARLWPLTWLLALLDRPGLGTGFVWRTGKRVIGNASLYPGGKHPWLGPGWLVANVAVHPDYRRQGIASALMQAGCELVREQHGHWIALQMEAGNTAVEEFYRKHGFETYETLTFWEKTGLDQLVPADVWPIRPRRFQEAPAEADLIYNRARRGAMAWGQPIEQSQVQGGLFGNMEVLLSGQHREHWVLPDPNRPDRLLGSLWADISGWRSVRLSLFLDPALHDPRGRQALLHTVLSNRTFAGWSLRVETAQGDPLIEEILRSAGFHQVRALTQMRCLL